MVDFTVAICTYNGEARLPKVLECLRIACGNAIPTPSSLESSASHCDAELRSDFISIANKADIASHIASATLTRKSLTQATPSEASVQETRSLSAVSTEHFSWEVIVIDNNSTDNTAKVVQEYQANWSNDYPLRYYFEPVQGVAFARRRAIK